ncbi:MAG: sodium/proline symporter PutP [Balneolaceae bacterium]|nr:MAG: sodium/proline symporter PutP [Balneolaceae bacterium]
MNPATLTTFIIYLVALIGFGILFYRYTHTLSDYILGGRKLGSGVAALSAGASDMSGWLLLGLPGAVYAFGLNQIWIAIGLTIGAYLNWQFVAKKLRKYTEVASDSITIPDYLEYRFYDKSRMLRVISALVILVFFAIYTASGLVAGATLFESAFDLAPEIALYTGAIIIVAYTFLGGFLAVSWTDFFQGILMLLALIAAPVIIIITYMSWDEIISTAAAIDPAYLDVFSNMTYIGIISLLAWGLGYFGQPHILARFMAIRSEEHVPKAKMIAMVWMVFALYGAIFVGFTGISFFADSPLAAGEQEIVFLELTQVLFNPWVAGIILAAILSAVMSTVDSQLLVCSSAVSEDFYKAFLKPKASEKELVLVSRLAVVGVAIIALYLASNPENLVLDLVAYAWAGFGASFGPVIILSLFWRRMTRNGALAGMVTGAATVLIWENLSLILPGLEHEIFTLYSIIPGFLFCTLAVIITSNIGDGPSDEIHLQHDKI